MRKKLIEKIETHDVPLTEEAKRNREALREQYEDMDCAELRAFRAAADLWTARLTEWGDVTKTKPKEEPIRMNGWVVTVAREAADVDEDVDEDVDDADKEGIVALQMVVDRPRTSRLDIDKVAAALEAEGMPVMVREDPYVITHIMPTNDLFGRRRQIVQAVLDAACGQTLTMHWNYFKRTDPPLW